MAPKPAIITPPINCWSPRPSPKTTKDTKYVPISHKALLIRVITMLANFLITRNVSSVYAPVKTRWPSEQAELVQVAPGTLL